MSTTSDHLSDAEYLRQRYGNTDTDRRPLWIAAVVLGILALAWIVWWAIAAGRPTATAEPVGMEVISDSEVHLTYNLTAPVGSTVTCTVTALTDNLTEVGVRQVTVGPTEREVTAVTTSLATIMRATGVDVTGCVFVDDGS